MYNMSKVTIVSALFYIGRDKWKHSGFGLNNDRYKWWLENILSLDTNIVLFTDSHYYDRVIEIKKKYDPDLKKIRVIKMELSDTEVFVKYYSKISCLMKSPEFIRRRMYDSVAEMLYPLYNVLMYNKINFIQEAAALNPFDSTHFYWADAGAFRNELVEYKNVKWPDENLNEYFNDKIVFFSHAGDQYVIEDQPWYFMSQSRVVQGGYFIVPKEKIQLLKEQVYSVIDEILAGEYIGSDEKVFDLVCKRNKEHVKMIKAGWFEFYKKTMPIHKNFKIYVTVYTRPEFITLQHEQLIKNCRDNFEYIVINNAKNEEIEKEVLRISNERGIRIISVKKDHSVANISHFNAINTAFDVEIKNRKDYEAVVIMDSDVFPYRPFYFRNILKDNDSAALYQQRQDTQIEYFCPIFTMISDKVDISDINFAWKTYTDCGGCTDDFIKKHKLSPRWVNHTAAIDIETDYIFTKNKDVQYPYKPQYRSQFIENCFIHYYRGCNWDEQSPEYHKEKFEFLKYFLQNYDNYGLNLDWKVCYEKAHAEKGWEGKDHNYRGYKFLEK